ncbi:hypothetical protein FSB74_22740, partial [Pseudomonas aeruginosa]
MLGEGWRGGYARQSRHAGAARVARPPPARPAPTMAAPPGPAPPPAAAGLRRAAPGARRERFP